MLKAYHHLTILEFALSLHFNPIRIGKAQTSLDSLRKDVTRVCAACMGEHTVKWKAGAQSPKEYFCRGCTSSITSLPEQHMTQGRLVLALCPQSLPTSLLPFSFMGDEEPWVCRDDLKGQSGEGIKLCCFSFLSQLLCLVPLLASKPTAASPVVSIQALKLFKLFAERCSPSVRSNRA